MFTGIVEELGKIKSITIKKQRSEEEEEEDKNLSSKSSSSSSSHSLEIIKLIRYDKDKDKDIDNGDDRVIKDLKNSDEEVISLDLIDRSTRIGDSISINGTCLTIVDFNLKNYYYDDDDNNQRFLGWSFIVDLSPETLRVTNLKFLKVGDMVNLERAMSSNSRFGGHFVQGHVDTTARIVKIQTDEDSIRFTFELCDPDEMMTDSQVSIDLIKERKLMMMRYLVQKGYITIDGISLTLNQIDQSNFTFSICLIPHSQSIVSLTHKGLGDFVNVEFDILVKTIVNLFNDHQSHSLASNSSRQSIRQIVTEVLEERDQSNRSS